MLTLHRSALIKFSIFFLLSFLNGCSQEEAIKTASSTNASASKPNANDNKATIAPPKSLSNTSSSSTQPPGITPAILGNILFNDPSLSNPAGLACRNCHDEAKAFADPGMAVSEGAVKGTFGSRNTPSLKYAMLAPALIGQEGHSWSGGLLWDGRVNTLEEQALMPLFNPAEMNNTEAKLAQTLRQSTYIQHFATLYGENTVKDDTLLTKAAANALQAFQQTDLFKPYNSKFDYVAAGLLKYTEQEKRGQALFRREAACTDCHQGFFNYSEQFTSYGHHNIHTPVNTHLAFYTQPESINPEGKAFIDKGTAANPQLSEAEKNETLGLFRTPTLRNIALTAPYMHNGVFKTLEEVIDFYNDPAQFPKPEVVENRSDLLAFSLNLTQEDKAALIAFLKTLSDDYPADQALQKQLRGKQEALRKTYSN